MICRLIRHQPCLGVWNMAVDEALLHSAAMPADANQHQPVPVLRFYRWSEPTLTLGYFQKAADRQQHQSSLKCPMTRRSSGGGALIHDQEWTYSFVVPAQTRGGSEQLYNAFHESLAELLCRFGLQAYTFPQTDKTTQPEPFLCFQRRSRGDLCVGDTKVMGSAQRRIRNAVLQHGSLLFQQSQQAPELNGLTELGLHNSISDEKIIDSWADLLTERLELEIYEDSLTDQEAQLADRFSSEKYANDQWVDRR